MEKVQIENLFPLPEDVKKELKSPDWRFTSPYDWKEHVSEEVKTVWHSLSVESKTIIAYYAIAVGNLQE